jgi:hypothetical protein
VNVIFDAAHFVEHALLGANDAAHVWVESLRDLFFDPRLAAFGAEDNV